MMRLRRLCEKKSGGKLNCDPDVHEQWLSGNRESLALALVHALKTYGFADNKKTRDAVRVPGFQKNVSNMFFFQNQKK